MVNVKSSRHDLICILKESTGAVSGENISAKLGISRVAVWKHVKKLEDMGYHIDSSRKGYELLSEPEDFLQPHLFDNPEQFFCLKETESTMDYTENLLHKRRGTGKEGGEFIVTAETQTAGRGRYSRDWISREGGLFFTHTFPAILPVYQSYQVTMAALVSLVEILRDDYHQPAEIKWPNDILIKRRKVLGLLSTGRFEGERMTRFSLGIGINVNNAPPLPESTCSLGRLTGKNLSRSDLVSGYLRKMKHYRELRDLSRYFIKLSTLRGEMKVLTEKDRLISGTFHSLSPEGALILDSGDRIYPGECKKIIRNGKG